MGYDKCTLQKKPGNIFQAGKFTIGMAEVHPALPAHSYSRMSSSSIRANTSGLIFFNGLLRF